MANFSSTYPSTRPVFNADFSNAGRLDSRITFSRPDTPPTYAAPSAVHYWSNEKHLSSENLLLQSQSFDTSWAMVNGSAPSGSQSAPDGTSTAWLLTANTGSSQSPRLRQAPTLSATTEYTLTVCLKAGTASHGFIAIRGQSGHSAYALIDFSAGTASSAGSGFSGVSNTVTALGASWFKLSLTATTNSSLSSQWIYIGPSDGTAPSSAGYPAWNTSGETMYAWGAQLNTTGATVYDSPTTTQIARSYASSLKSVSTAGQPRFEYSPTDSASAAMGESLGLLIEGQSTNLLAGSATIGGTYWGVVNATSQQNSAVAPDGTLTAATLVENSAGGAKYAYTNNFTPAASTTYTFSAFVKPNGRNFCMIYTGLGGVNQSSMFDLITGATSNLSGSGVNTATQCGNGWWRLSVTVTTTSTTTANFQILPATDATTFDYTGNGYSGLICWGAMLEQSSFASSYIGTTSSAVTRAADSASLAMSSAGVSQGPVSAVVEGSAGSGTYPHLISLSDTTSSNRWLFYRPGAPSAVTTNYRLLVQTNGSSVVNADLSGSASATKFAMRVGTDDFAACAGGGAVVTDTAGVAPVTSTIHIANGFNGSYQANGHVKRIALYGEALSDTNLQALTS